MSLSKGPAGVGAGSPRAEDFHPSPWLPGAHLQTAWGSVTRSRTLVTYRREAVSTPDGDELLLDHVDPIGDSGLQTPLLLVLHGLEGSSYSVYVQGLLALAHDRSWRGVAMNFRSCARRPERKSVWIPNHRPRLYHSGETSDLGLIVSLLAARYPDAPLLAAGASLGGNVLLKWLGENPGQKAVTAAGTISVPYDLGAGGRYMERGLGPYYVGNLLRTLRQKAVDVAVRFPEAARLIDVPGARRARTFFEFDEAANAPLHGFTGAADYYARSSSLGFVGKIQTPTLCISAEDDPFLPASVLAAVDARRSGSVSVVITRRGGHVGFIAGTRRLRYWAEETVVDWLARRLQK